MSTAGGLYVGTGHSTYKEGTTVDQPDKPQFTFVMSGAGRQDSAHFTLNVWREISQDVYEPRVTYNGTVKLDGDPYGPAEWIREVIMGMIEGL